jgi:hypothetical protein
MVNKENILLMKNWEKFTKKQKQPKKAERFCLTVNSTESVGCKLFVQ